MNTEQLEELLSALESNDEDIGESFAILTMLAPSLARRVIAAEKMAEALKRIRDLNLIGVDDNGQQWANSDLIDQEVTFALTAYRNAIK